MYVNEEVYDFVENVTLCGCVEDKCGRGESCNSVKNIVNVWLCRRKMHVCKEICNCIKEI